MKNKRHAQFESALENGVQNQLIRKHLNKDPIRITYPVKEPSATSCTNLEERVRAACF